MRPSAPEFLLIDVGNTRLKWATAKGRGPIRLAGDISTKAATPKWMASLAKKYPDHPVVFASVVPKLRPSFRRALGERLIEVNSALPTLGFRFRYPKPSEIGADRLAAAVAAHAHAYFPAIIVACGTATAFTVLDAGGRFRGGAIAPGLEAQLTALLGATAQLPATTLRAPRSALARTTREALRAGLMLNFQGGVKEIVNRLIESLPARPKPRIILTGGNARHLVEHLEIPFKLRPLLVFEGLLIIGNRLFTPSP
jgi:type III pantothenate kinase